MYCLLAKETLCGYISLCALSTSWFLYCPAAYVKPSRSPPPRQFGPPLTGHPNDLVVETSRNYYSLDFWFCYEMKLSPAILTAVILYLTSNLRIRLYCSIELNNTRYNFNNIMLAYIFNFNSSYKFKLRLVVVGGNTSSYETFLSYSSNAYWYNFCYALCSGTLLTRLLSQLVSYGTQNFIAISASLASVNESIFSIIQRL